MTDRRRTLGSYGEDVVAKWYVANGYALVARNWRSKSGEIDVIVSRGNELIICEVKTRSSRRFGSPFEAVTATKQRRIRGLALEFLSENRKYRGRQLRFDVAGVEPSGVEILEAAF